ncbi:MAG TPA: methyltransferase domain-containing protein [Thermoanaerobaculia bacterium]
MGLFKRARGAADDGLPRRLHIGCGQQSIPGWINIDNQGLPGVDQVLDVRHGLPFRGVAAIYAEHFLEHLSLEEGLAFLHECRRVLAPEGTLRLSTPNLDWVVLTHYHGPALPENQARVDCFRLNRAFHGWGHQFLYNATTLASALRAAGFERIEPCRYGESGLPELAGLERHEKSEDTPDLPHVLIVEASGSAAPVPIPEDLVREFREAVAAR